MGQVQYSRAYYWGEECHHSEFSTDAEFGLLRRQTPAMQQVTAMAGSLSAFKSGAERVLRTMSGVRLSESTVQRTTEEIGQLIDDRQSQGEAVAPAAEWKWHRDNAGRPCAYLSLDATGVRQQGPNGEKAEGRMAWVLEVFNPIPQPPAESTPAESTRAERIVTELTVADLAPVVCGPNELAAPAHKRAAPLNPAPTKPQAQARYSAGLMDLAEAGRRLRCLAESVQFQKAEVVIGLTDGGTGLADCLETHCLSGLSATRVLILDFYHLSEHLEGFAREWIADEATRAEQVARWCHIAKHQGGEALLTDLKALDLKGCRQGVKETYRRLVQYVGNNLFRMDYPRYEAAGWQIGSGNIESACKTVINQRLNSGGMRWREYGTNAVGHVRALFCSESIVWDDFWRHRSQPRAA